MVISEENLRSSGSGVGDGVDVDVGDVVLVGVDVLWLGDGLDVVGEAEGLEVVRDGDALDLLGDALDSSGSAVRHLGKSKHVASEPAPEVADAGTTATCHTPSAIIVTTTASATRALDLDMRCAYPGPSRRNLVTTVDTEGRESLRLSAR